MNMKINQLKLIIGGACSLVLAAVLCFSGLLNVNAAVGCFIFIFAAAGVIYYRAEKKKAAFDAQKAISRVNRELQFVSGEHKETTRALQRQRELIEVIITSMEEGVVATDAFDTVIEVNEYFANLACKSRKEILGEAVFDCMPDESGKRVKDIIGNLRKNPDGKIETIRQVIGNRNFEIKVQPIYRQGRYAGAVLNIIDITGLIEEAEQANQAKEQFLSQISYEIRTSLNSIIGFAELLRKDKLTDEQAEFAETIYTCSENLLETIDEICWLAKTEPSRLQGYEATKSGPSHSGSAKENASEATEKMSKPAATDGESNVLIVDDVTENRALIEILLQKAGYRITLCGDGKEAVEIAETEKFDIILMDVRMPVMNGLEATRVIRSGRVNSTTPVIAMTANVAKDDKLLCLEAGCDDYISKPIRKDLLLTKLERYIQQTRQIETAALGGDITSFLADNPDYHKTIEMFVSNLPERIQQMQDALEQENLEDLNFKVHALKGLGGFAGFAIYSEKARVIEEMLKDNKIDKVRQQLDEMAGLCLRTRFASR